MNQHNTILKKISYCGLLTLFTQACDVTPQFDGTNLPYGMGSCYTVAKNEDLVTLDSLIQMEYAPYAQSGNLSYPVNRVLKAENLTTIIVIPQSNSFSKNTKAISELEEPELLEKYEAQEGHMVFLQKNEGKFNVQHFLFKDDLPIVFNFMTADESVAREIYKDKNYINERSCSFD